MRQIASRGCVTAVGERKLWQLPVSHRRLAVRQVASRGCVVAVGEASIGSCLLSHRRQCCETCPKLKIINACHLKLQVLQGCAPVQVLDAADVVAGKGGHLQACQPLQVLEAPDAQSPALQIHHVGPPVRAPVPQLLAGAVPWQPGECWSDQRASN